MFHDPRHQPALLEHRTFATAKIPLSKANFRHAVLASGSIPVIMKGVRRISGAPDNIYLDGGILDYHLDLPLRMNPQKIIFYPHYSLRLIPGWLDKGLKWRKPSRRSLSNMILISPTPEFIRQLPLGKIPDRNDFITFKGRDEERVAMWKKAVQKSRRLADELHDLLESGRIASIAQPFPPVYCKCP
jgi:hypothetical protein